MTVLLVAIGLLGVFSIPLVSVPPLRRARRNLLAPAQIAAGLHILTIIPFLLFVAADREFVDPLVREHPAVTDLEGSIAWFGLVQAIGFLALLFGLNSRLGREISKYPPIVAARITPRRLWAAAIASFAIGLGSYAYVINKIGGFALLIGNLDRRTQLVAGMNYLTSLRVFLIFGVLLVLYSFRWRFSLPKLLLLAVVTLLSFFMLSSFGGRTHAIQLAIMMVITWHFGVRRIKRLPVKLAMLFALLVPYIVAMPLIRRSGGVDYYIARPEVLLDDITENVGDAVNDIGFIVNHHVLTVSYFSIDNLWLGRTYADLITAPIPSSVYPEKPPVDDGVYLRSIAEGQTVYPPMSRLDLFRSSWPPETLGIMYMNFWLVGVVIGLFVLGVCYRAVFEYMLRSENSLFAVVVYGFVMLNFQLSNIRLVQTAIVVVLAALYFAVFFGARWSRASYKNPQHGGIATTA